MADIEHMERIVEMLAATAEAMGQTVAPTALAVMAGDLSGYPLAKIMAALTRCRRELRGRLTLADVIDRLEEADGRLSGDEAWAMVIASRDEAVTIVWTDEIEEAAGAAGPILRSGDKVGARMAFLRAYDRIVQARRDAGAMPVTRVSLGHDPAERAAAINAAVAAGKLTHQDAQRYLPAPEPTADGVAIAGLLTGRNVRPHPTLTAERLEAVRRALRRSDDLPLKTSADIAAERRESEEARRAEVLAEIDLMRSGASREKSE